jgi:Subtilase family
MKKMLTALVVLVVSAGTLPAQAALKNSTVSTPTLAILDTALDTSIPQIKEKLVGEVCILDWNSCPNGQAFMEGEGASVLPMNILSNNNFNHGTQMVSVAINNNPNMNILFVRIIGHTTDGRRQMTKATLVPRVLEWLYANKEKYNIKAISMSQGHHNLLKSTDYCPVNTGLDTVLLKLNSVDIPVMFAVGNDRDYSRIDWPACNMSPNVFAIAGSESYNAPATYNNHDLTRTDFFDYGNQKVLRPGGIGAYAAGSSVATASFSAKWLAVKSAKNTLTISQISDVIKNTSISIKNSLGTSGNLINIGSAING